MANFALAASEEVINQGNALLEKLAQRRPLKMPRLQKKQAETAKRLA